MNTTPHLTDDQIDDALIGDLASACAAHLSDCDHCQARLAEAEAPITSFNEVALAWSERRSATLPSPAPADSSWLPKALWAASAAVALAVGVSFSLDHRAATHAPAKSPVRATMMASTGPLENPTATREEHIAQDNQMLESIDRELQAPAAESLASEYGLAPAGRSRDWHTSKITRN